MESKARLINAARNRLTGRLWMSIHRSSTASSSIAKTNNGSRQCLKLNSTTMHNTQHSIKTRKSNQIANEKQSILDNKINVKSNIMEIFVAIKIPSCRNLRSCVCEQIAWQASESQDCLWIKEDNRVLADWGQNGCFIDGNADE